MPALYYLNRTQKLMDKLPLLDAARLEASQLPMAATVWSILASAYWRHGLETSFNIHSTIEDGGSVHARPNTPASSTQL
jgi:hypothetical protein